MDTIEVRVKFCYGTYIARANGKAASCTAGEKQAVEALAAKVVDGPSVATEDLDRRGIWHVRSAA